MTERFGLDLIRAAVLMSLGAGLLASARPAVWLGVAGGNLLALGVFWSVRHGVDALLERAGRGPRARSAILVNFFTRHAIVALAAWFMIARLQVSAVALAAGVSSLLVAAGMQVLRARPWSGTTAHLSAASSSMPGRRSGQR